MEKTGKKRRDITFRSDKNARALTVHSRRAREYARCLEADEAVRSYEPCRPLDKSRYCYVNPAGIRKTYFEAEWSTDFLVKFKDGTSGVRELTTEEELAKRAELEKLEFSRRYWKADGITDWKMVIMKEEKKDVL